MSHADSAPAAHVWPAPSSLAEPPPQKADPDDARTGVSDPPRPTDAGEVAASVSSAPQETPTPAPPIQSQVAPPSNTRRAARAAETAQSAPAQISPRRPVPLDDRPPGPIVYQPVSSPYATEMRPPMREATARNVPARAAVVLLVLALIGGVAVVGWLAGWDRTIAGLVSLVSVAFAAGGFFLAIAGLIVAGQRSTSRTLSAIALVASLALAVLLGFVATEQALAILA